MYLIKNVELVKLMKRLDLNAGADVKKALEYETKLIVQDKRLRGCLTYDNIKKLFYLTINNKINTAHLFITAASSDNIKTKQLGYLGMQLNPNDSHSFLLINTIKRDLTNKETRIMAINFLANMCKRFALFKELLKSIDIYGDRSEFSSRELIAYYTLNMVGADIRIVEITPKNLFVKLQILIDNMKDVLQSGFTCENDIKYLQCIAMRTKDKNLLIKILQFLRMYTKKEDGYVTKTFYKFVDSKIISGNIINKELLYMALSMEATEFLLSMQYNSINAHGFIFRLVEANDDYLNICAFRLVKQYGIHCRIAIHRIIEKGITNKEFLNTLLELISCETCDDLYREKDRSIQIMQTKQFKKEYIIDTWDKLMLKMFTCCEEPLKMTLFKENLYLHDQIDINEIFSKNICSNLFEDLKNSEEVEIFCIIHKLINILKYSKMYSIYEKQLPRILDQYIIDQSKSEHSLFISLFDCIYNNESIYYTHSLLHKTSDHVLQTNNKNLISIHRQYCNIIESMMIDKYLKLKTEDTLYYSFELIDGIKKRVYIKCLNSYIIEADINDEYFIVKKIDDLWNEYELELYDFEANAVRINIYNGYGIVDNVTLTL